MSHGYSLGAPAIRPRTSQDSLTSVIGKKVVQIDRSELRTPRRFVSSMVSGITTA